jgi:hypothetical protein
MEFDLQVHGNEFLGEDDRTITAVVTVSADGGGETGDAESAEVLLVDCSTSMRWPAHKIVAARRAAEAAVEVLPDGVFFAVLAGTTRAVPVYPERGMARADARTRAEAGRAVRRLTADGGTAIGAWLTAAGALLAEHPDAVRHAILLTDGKNQSQSRAELDLVLDACEGQFTCDARGIGDDWDPHELTRIVTVLRGTADSVVAPDELPEDFRRLTEAAVRRTVPEVRLRIGTMPFSALRYVKQMHPAEYDLTERCREVEPGVLELATGSWSDGEDREYLICLDLTDDAAVPDQEIQLAWLELVGWPAQPRAVTARWTDDPVQATRINPVVQRYTVQAELGQAMTEGYDAYTAHDLARAERAWGRAVALAVAADDGDLLRRLTKLVRVIDAAAGEVRLRANLSRSEIMKAVLVSRMSTVHRAGLAPPGNALVQCPHCRKPHPAGERVCPETLRRIAP